LGGLQADAQTHRHLLGLLAFGDELQHLALPRCEWIGVQGFLVPVGLDENLRNAWTEVHAVTRNIADCAQQIGAGFGLDHVTMHTRVHRFDDVRTLLVHGQQDDSGARARSGDSARHIEAVETRQRNIDDGDVRLQALDELHTLQAIAGLTYHLIARLTFKQLFYPLQQNQMIIHDHYAYHRVHCSMATLVVSGTITSIEVPMPGVERMLQLPPTALARSRMPSRPSLPLLPLASTASTSKPRPSSLMVQ